MIIELTGEVISVSYKHGSWMMEVELKQEIVDGGFRALNTVNLRISKEAAIEMTSGEMKFLKILVEGA